MRLTVSALCLLPALGLAANVEMPESAAARIEKLLKDGRYGDAEKDLRQAQSADKGSARLKFLQCVLQAQQGTAQKGIACFQRLVQEHPELPEAYNNIGVLYAGMGSLVEARKWFERGLTQQQAYAALHQNLLNLQAEVNRTAYASALQLDISKSSTQPKLTLLGRISSVTETPAVAAVAVVQPATSAASATTAPPPVPAAPAAPVASAAAPASPPKPVTNPVTVAAAAVKAASAEKPAAASASAAKAQAGQTPAPGGSTTEQAARQTRVQDAVQAWAAAWARKDMDAYLQAYSSTFNPGQDVTRQAWEEQRRIRIVSKKQIRIELSQFKISIANGKATASFTQNYESGAMHTVSRKTLELVENKGQWLITREYSGGA